MNTILKSETIKTADRLRQNQVNFLLAALCYHPAELGPLLQFETAGLFLQLCADPAVGGYSKMT